MLVSGLADQGSSIVAGGGYGIDAAAHRAALATNTHTVAVLAGGVDLLYPVGNAELLERITVGDSLVSEAPPGAAPTRMRHLARNRLLAALSATTVVVEAAAHSGALNVAERARDIGRPLCAVPGPLTSANSAGTNALIRGGGASLVTNADDITELARSPLSSLHRTFGFDAPERTATRRDVPTL
jgi:DNA processing protein